MTAETPLPGAAAGPACVRLAGGLRELRTRTGLSLTALAERTAYSRSSWGRYLDGKQLAPRHAVEALCVIAREPPARLVALWELADLEWSGRHRTSAAPSREEPPSPPSPAVPADDRTAQVRTAQGRAAANPPAAGRRTRGIRGIRGARPRVWVLTAAGCAVVAVAATLWATSSPGAGGKGGASHAASPVSPAPACDAQTCTGEDPQMMGCAMPGQAHRLGHAHRTRTGARLSFSYSHRCHTAWALVWQTRVGDVLAVSVRGSGPQRVRIADRYDAEGPVVTPMVDGSDLTGLRACFTPGAGGSTECFSR